MDRGVTPSAPCGHQTKGPTVFNLPVGWFKQNTSQISRFPSLSPLIASISHCSQHSSHQILSLSHVNYCPHTSSSLPPSLPPSHHCLWRARSGGGRDPSAAASPRQAERPLALTIWYDWAGMSATPVRVSLTIQCMSHVSYLSHLSLPGGGCQGQ